MLKIMVVVKRRAGLSREEFVRHWRDLHPEFVRALPNIRGYCQNLAIEHRAEWPFDGIAELRFDSRRDIAIAFEGPAAQALFEHEREFIGEMEWAVTEEAEIEI